MVQINFGRKEVSCKIVYYGPGMSGKTTNIEVVHQKVPEQNRGELNKISTDGDRTLFFDYFPLELGSIAGMKTKFQLYTVPGQVYYNSTRKLVLQGVDGVVFVGDSSPSKQKENLESFRNLEENLREYGKELRSVPHVIQFNKRDLADAMSLDQMNTELNLYGAAVFEATAATGQGVFPTLKALAALVLESVNKNAAAQPSSAAPAASGVSAGAPGVAAGTVTAGSAPASTSPFTRNVPGGMAKPAAASNVSTPAGVAPAQRELPHLMATPRPTPAASGAHSATSAFGAGSASKIARAPVSPVRKPVASAPVATAKPAKKISKGAPKSLVFGLVFGALVLAAAGGIVLLFAL